MGFSIEQTWVEMALVVLVVVVGPASGMMDNCSWQSLFRGLFFIPDLYRTDTIRTSPSFPGWSSTICPKDHCWGGSKSSFTRTSSPMEGFPLSALHLLLCCNFERYSCDHLFQICCWNLVNIFHLNATVASDKLGCGGARSGRPIRKWPGVSCSKSCGSDDIWPIGLEFKQASTWYSTVVNSSNVNNVSPSTRFKCFLTDLTPASKMPPKWGAAAGINFHCVPLFAAYSATDSVELFVASWRSLSNQLFAPTKLVPLYISVQLPLRAMNLV